MLYQLPLAHDIAAVAPTCHQFCDAAKLAQKLRPFSGEVVTLPVSDAVHYVVTAAEGQIVTGTINQATAWMNGLNGLTFHTHAHHLSALEMLPDGVHFITGSVTAPGEGCEAVGYGWFSQAQLRYWSSSRSHRSVCRWHALVMGEWRGYLKLFRMDGTLVRTIKGHSRHVVSLAATPDGQHFISGSDDKRIKVWSVDSETCVSSWNAGSEIYALAVTPDGTRVVSVSLSAQVKVWLLDGTLENTFKLHSSVVHALVAMPDNQHALSASGDAKVKLFNINDGAVLRTFRHHAFGVSCLALLPDGLRFVSGSYDAPPASPTTGSRRFASKIKLLYLRCT